MSAPESGRVTVTGAAGFIGRYVVEELLRQGWRVRAAVRPGDSIPLSTNLEVVEADVRDVGAVARALAGATAVISLAALKSDEPESEATNVGGARNLLEACRATGCFRLINISSQSAKLARKGLYGRTKLAADEIVAASGLDYTTLRPSLVYGPGRSGAFATVQRFVERLPVVPVLGDGRWISAPVHVEDVARAISSCLLKPATIGRCYDLGGPDEVAFDALIDRISAMTGTGRCRKFHIPLGISLAGVRVIKAVFPTAPFTVSNVLGSNQDTGIDSRSAHRDLGFVPRRLEEGLGQILGSTGDHVLSAEARRLGRYLLRETPGRDLVERYAAGVQAVFGASLDGSVRFLRRHPWSLPWLDAALSVCRPEAQLRQRVLLMAAILETTPLYAEFFLGPPPGRARLFIGLCRRGVAGAVKIVIGFLLLPLVSRDDAPAR